MNYTQEQINSIVAEAKAEAKLAANEFFKTHLGSKDTYPCGFAWVNILGVKGNTKLGKMLKVSGLSQDYTKEFQIWNPAGLSVQNVDTLKAGAIAAATVFRKYGFNSTFGSRLD